MLSVGLSVTVLNTSSHFVSKAWTLSFFNWTCDKPLNAKMASLSPHSMNGSKLKKDYTIWVVSQQVALSWSCFVCDQDELLRRCGRSFGLLPCLRCRRISPWRLWWRWPSPWRPRWPLFIIGFYGLFSNVFPCSTVQLVFRFFFGLYGIAASSLIGLYDFEKASVINPFVRRSDVSPFLLCHSVKFFHVGLWLSLFRACAVGTSRPRGRAPRLFRNSFFLRNPSNFLFFWVVCYSADVP